MTVKKEAATPIVACRFCRRTMFDVGGKVARLTAASGQTSWKYGSWAWPAVVGDGAGHPKEGWVREQLRLNRPTSLLGKFRSLMAP